MTAAGFARATLAAVLIGGAERDCRRLGTVPRKRSDGISALLTGAINVLEKSVVDREPEHLSAKFDIWQFEPEAWQRIQEATGAAATGEVKRVWKHINTALAMARGLQAYDLFPTLTEERTKKRQLLKAIEDLIGQLGIHLNPTPPVQFQIRADTYSWIVTGTADDSVNAKDAQPTQQVATLIEKLSSNLSEMHDYLSASLVGSSDALPRKSPHPAKAAFVRFVAEAYEAAYGKPSKSGGNENAGMSSPAVRFIDAVAIEARRTEGIEPRSRAFVRRALHMTPNTINRILRTDGANQRPSTDG